MSAIEWTDETLNVVTGCDRCSPGCDHCYIERTPPFRMAGRRFDERGHIDVLLHPERLDKPLRWKKPRRVFVNSLADLFHPDVPEHFLAELFAVMARTPQHTYQILTKRPQRMALLLASEAFGELVRRAGAPSSPNALWHMLDFNPLPLPNVWLGVSVEDQRYADLRIPHLLATPAAVRFLSVEPLLGPVSLGQGYDHAGGRAVLPDWSEDEDAQVCQAHGVPECRQITGCMGVDWVIVGGESGPGARPMHPQWARDLRDQCVAAGVPFFFKQWGEWAPHGLPTDAHNNVRAICLEEDGTILPWATTPLDDPAVTMSRVGKKAAGRELDGRTWDEQPERAA